MRCGKLDDGRPCAVVTGEGYAEAGRGQVAQSQKRPSAAKSVSTAYSRAEEESLWATVTASALCGFAALRRENHWSHALCRWCPTAYLAYMALQARLGHAQRSSVERGLTPPEGHIHASSAGTAPQQSAATTCRAPGSFVSFSVLLGEEWERSRVGEMPHLKPSPRTGKKMGGWTREKGCINPRRRHVDLRRHHVDPPPCRDRPPQRGSAAAASIAAGEDRGEESWRRCEMGRVSVGTGEKREGEILY